MLINTLTFKVIDQGCYEFFAIQKAFSNLIQPIYGPQDTALAKIGKGEDRLCEALFENNNPKGIIVYKKALSSGNLELKTLCLLEPHKDSFKGFGSMLVEKVIETAKRRMANKIIVTVSLESNALNFFQKNGFTIVGIGENKYKPEIKEYILARQADLDYKLSNFHAIESKPNQQMLLPSYSRLQEKPTITSSSFESVSPIYCSLQTQYIQSIASGQKTYEGRINTDFFAKYQPNQFVVWQAGEQYLKTQIVSRKEFPSFEAMLTEIGFKHFLPEAKSLEEAKKIYNNIPGYAEKSKKYGVLALGIKLPNELDNINYYYKRKNSTENNYEQKKSSPSYKRQK